jgi:hypothetical protein
MELETVKIKHNRSNGFIIINKTDYDPSTMELYGSVSSKPESGYIKDDSVKDEPVQVEHKRRVRK